MGELSVLDRTGDSKVIWDADNKDEVDAARTQFDALRKKGYIAYRVDKKGDKAEIMKTFDPEAEKVILSPAVVGG